MATFDGQCEPLHGHNYQVAVEVEGALTPDSWVIDFGLLKRLTREVCAPLDHRFLLQRDSHVLTIEELGDSVRLSTPAGVSYVLPRTDIYLLPADNSSSERLCEFIHGRLAEELVRAGANTITRLRIEIEEMPGQSAWFDAPPRN